MIDTDPQASARVSTHSRAEAAAIDTTATMIFSIVSTHSRAEAAATNPHQFWDGVWFQHTAARRRLRQIKLPFNV